MFTSARIKLTGWYLFIIMLISISFSVAIYGVLNTELDRVERVQRLRQERLLPAGAPQRARVIDPEVIQETEDRIKMTLILINFGILCAAGLSGYFLAGRTLKPISDMLEEQERFITDSSHELRTPLTSLKSEIEVSLRDEKLTLVDAKKLLKSNLEEVNNLQYLSDNLIKLTQYEKTNGNNFEEVDLSEVIEEAVRKVVNLAKSKKITIKNSVQNIKLEADKQSLVELFAIFLDNAIKYSQENTKVLIFSTLDGHPGGAQSIIITIKDQGIGIAEEDIPHIFDRFFRSDKSRSKEGVSGYGLGLSIAKQIAEKHKGSIKVISEIGSGTTFLIQFPIKARQ